MTTFQLSTDREYSAYFVEEAINELDVDSKDLISFFTHYIFVELILKTTALVYTNK